MDPLFPNPSDDPAGFIISQQRTAQSSALQGLDQNADDGARAVELGKATGADPSVVYGNLEQFEQQHKASLTSQLLQNNQFLRDYANSHPLAGVVSNDDWGQLDEVSHRVTGLYGSGSGGLLSAPADAVEAGVKGFYKAFTTEGKLGSWAIRDEDAQFAQDHPVLYNNLLPLAQMIGVPIEILNRTISGTVAGAGAAVQAVARAAGADEDSIKRIPEDVASLADAAMMTMVGGPHPIEGGALAKGKAVDEAAVAAKAKEQSAWIDEAHKLHILVRPYIENGEKPPVGLHEVIDKIYEEQTKKDVKDLEDLTKEAQASSTRERAPELFEDFVKSHGEATFGISVEAVRKLYGDKVPTADDNILGFIPHLAEQLAGAEQFGGRVEIPLSSWLARVDPEVAKALKDDIVVRKGGMTLNETKLEVPERPAPIDSVDAIRHPAGLDPMAAPEQMRLVRIEPDEDYSGHIFDIQDAQGKRVGGAMIKEINDGKTLYIDEIAGGTPDGLPGFLGQRQLTGLLRQLQVEFPNATHLEGDRVTGARQAAGVSGKMSIPLRPTPKQLTDFMRSGFEKQMVLDNTGKVHDVQPIYSTTVGESIPPEAVAKATDSPVMKYFGAKIHELTKDVPIHVISRADMDKIYGPTGDGFHQLHMDGKSNIFLPDDTGYWEPEKVLHIVMHEASHAATVAALESDFQLKTKARLLMNEVNGYLTTNDYAARKEHSYAFTNEKEFVAEGQSKEAFQERLKSVPIPRELWKDLGSEPANAWEALKNIVRELWERITGKEVPKNALDGLFKLSEEIETAQKEVQARGKVGTDFAPPKETQLELPGLTRIEDREAFEKATDIGMSAKRFKFYQEKIAERDEKDMELFRAQAERRERQRQTIEWKAEETRAREEARTNLQSRPDIAADNLLREGSYLGEKLKGRVRLDSDKLSAEQKSGLPDDYHKSGGANPDDIATMLGYHSPDAMLAALKQLHTDRGDLGPKEHVNNLAEKITQDHMTREFGNLEQNILEELKDHVISPTQFDILHEEMLALATKNNGELPISKADLKAWVKKQFSDMPISSHRVDDYLAASGRAERGMVLALEDGDFREALKFKQQQATSLLMANEAKAYEKLRKATDRIADRVAKPKYAGMDNNYLAHLRDILGDAGLRTGKSIQGLADDVSAAGDLTSFVQKESDMKHVQFLIPDWVYAGEKIPLDKMTYEQFKGFSDTVKQLYTLGREDKVFDSRGKKLSLREAVDNNAVPQLAKQGETGTPYNVQGVDKLVGAAKEVVYGKLIQPFSVFNRWDLGDKHGWFNMNVVYPAMSVASEYSARIKYYSAKLDEEFKGIKDVKMNAPLPPLLKRVSRDEMVNMTMENAQRVIMDMGNPSNRDKFIHGWKVNPDVLNAWLKANTTKEMWDTWQKVGDINKEAFSELREMIRDQNGVVPDLVELEPFVDPHGIQRAGWYSPMIYDQKELGSSRAADGLHAVNPADMGGLFDTGYFKASTATGSEIRRTSYAAPTDLTMNRLPQRMTQILYDTSFRPFVINFGKMLRDTDFRHAIERHSGEAVLHMMDDWLRDIVGGSKGISTVSDQTLGRISEFFRRNMIGSFIGGNIHTAEKHGITAAVNSIAEVGPINFAREVKTLFAMSPDGFKSNYNFALEKSLELQRRFQSMRETLGGQYEGLRFKDKGFWAARDWMLEKGGFMVGYSDMMSSVPSWLAEYKKQMAQLGDKFPDKLPQDYEGTAIEIANSIVLRAHGSTAITARPGAMRGSAMGRLFTSLYSVFNQMLQRQFEAYWRTEYARKNYKTEDKGVIAGHLGKAVLLTVTSTLWPILTEHMVTPDPEDKTKKQGVLKQTGELMAEGATLGIPVAREVVHGFMSGKISAGMLDSELEAATAPLMDVEKGAKMMDKEHGGKTIKDFTTLIGLATGLPGEAGNIMEAIFNTMSKSTQAPRNVAETYRAATTGKAKGQPDLIQRALIEPFGQKGRRK